MDGKTPSNIDEYIERHPEDVRRILRQIRETIRKSAPDAVEKISYQIPAFWQGENLVHFAAFSDHVSFFPTSSGVDHFRGELKQYKTSRGTIQFPLDEPVPYGLIGKITKFRVRESAERRKSRESRVNKSRR
jgi:uncharacterized protein YdhG (YjbR/CyaY superfamily)